MKKILVLLHIFYTDQIPYFMDKMRNISGVEWDLVVSGGNLRDEDLSQLREFKPDMRYIPTPNVGYDVWPFILCVRQVNLDDYSFVIKFHTKNTDDSTLIHFNGLKFIGAMWRDAMVNPLLGSVACFHRLCRLFENPRVGIVYARDVDMKVRGAYVEDGPMLQKELKRLGIRPRGKYYCAGTIFAVRAQALHFLKDERISESIFPARAKSHSSGTMAHVYERILTMAVTAQGYKRMTIPSTFARTMYVYFKRNVQPVLMWIFALDYVSREGYLQKYLRIMGITINLKRKYDNAE